MPAELLSRLLFPEEMMIAVTIRFLLRRPNDHFVAGKRVKLKHSAPRGYAIGRGDVYNLAKFVLDCLNELLYKDDRNVVSLICSKMWDSNGLCEGATIVEITPSDNIYC